MSWHHCPVCRKKCLCLDSRFQKARQNSYVRRRFVCTSGHRFSTVELQCPKGLSQGGAAKFLRRHDRIKAALFRLREEIGR